MRSRHAGRATHSAFATVRISPRDTALQAGQTIGLRVVVAANRPELPVTVRWQSSEPQVATISQSGVVTAVESGRAFMRALWTIDSTAWDSIAVMVSGPSPFVRRVTVNPPGMILGDGQQLQLTALVDAAPGVSREVTWSSSDTKGEPSEPAGPIEPPPPITVIVRVEPRTALIRVGDRLQLADTMYIRGATFARTVMWSSSRPEVAAVSDSGLVTAVGTGNAFVRALWSFDARWGDSAAVTVILPLGGIRSITVAPTSVILGDAQTIQLTAGVDVRAGASTDVEWRVGDTTLVKLSTTGRITIPCPGQFGLTTVTATAIGDTTVRAEVGVRTRTWDTMAIQKILSSPQLRPANLNRLSGKNELTLNADTDCMPTERFDLLLGLGTGERLLASIPSPPAVEKGPTEIVFPFDLGGRDSTGAPLFPSGSHQLVVRRHMRQPAKPRTVSQFVTVVSP